MSSIPTNLKWVGLIQSEKKWKHQLFRRLRAANSVVRGRICPNLKLIQALMYIIITCKYEKDPIKNNRKKWEHRFFNYITICCHGNQWSDLAEIRTHLNFNACPHCVCGTVSSMLSRLETRSLGLNTLGTMQSPASSLSVHVGRPSNQFNQY